MRRPAALVVAALALLGCRRETVPEAAREPAAAASAHPRVTVDPQLLSSNRIEVGPVERRAPKTEVHAPGDVRSSEAASAEVGPLVSGRVQSLLAKEGDRVKRGDVLAWIAAPDVGRARADLLRARAKVEIADRKLARQLDLEKQQATSANAVDEARADDAAAKAELAAARALLSSLGAGEPGSDAHVANAVPLRTPIDGVVSKRDVVLGEPVGPDKTLYRVVAPGAVYVAAHVPETSPAPSMGAKATVSPRSGGPPCGATVAGVPPVIEGTTRTWTVRLVLDASCPPLPAGAYVDVVFAGPSAPTSSGALVVPRDAVVDVRGVPVAFVAIDGGTFEARAVRTSPAGADLIVESGLSEGDRVVVKGAVLLKGELQRSELEGGP